MKNKYIYLLFYIIDVIGSNFLIYYGLKTNNKSPFFFFFIFFNFFNALFRFSVKKGKNGKNGDC